MNRQLPVYDSARLHRRAWLRALIAGTVGLTLMSLFGGSSCHIDDDDWDDDDCGCVTLAESVPSYRLEHFELVPSAELGAHPVARLERIQGLSLGAWAGSRELGRGDFVEFTAKVLEHNDSLIGLPPSAGALVLAAVDFEPDGTLVRYTQVKESAGDPLPGRELVFRFDLIGNLLSIANSTVL